MPEPTLPQNQIIPCKLACILGAVGGAIGLAAAIAEMTGTIAGTRHGTPFLKDLIWAGSGATQVVLAILLWKGSGWAFKPFAQVSVLLGFLFLSRSMGLLGLINFAPLILFMVAASPAPLPPPRRIEPERRERY